MRNCWTIQNKIYHDTDIIYGLVLVVYYDCYVRYQQFAEVTDLVVPSQTGSNDWSCSLQGG